MDTKEYEKKISDLERQLASEKARADSLELRLIQILRSRSWRIVKILQKVYRLLGGRRLRTINAPQSIVARSYHIKELELPISEYAPLSVNSADDPTVTILIAAYNHFYRTYNCIDAIIRNTEDITYEIIVVDDCSDDITKDIESVIKGIKYVRNTENLQFLRSCNSASQYARGKYLMFLNNDTEVQADWLKPLVTLLENDPTIGLTGSKLLYPDGRLQEAGGIIWQDASGANYGNGTNPSYYEYNYVKEVDYITGAAVLISRSLWENIGKFDERFAPTYYEDADLAFAVRKMGYRVVYQPLSEVVHFEGTSNGMDITQGDKRYQVRNMFLFRDKWHEALLNEQGLPCENTFRKRERTGDKKIALLIDTHVPEFDSDAGSRTIFQYIQVLLHMGYCVKFLGDDFRTGGEYVVALQQMGVEVLYSVQGGAFWKSWIKKNGRELDYVLINRAYLMNKYSNDIRRYTNAKLVFNLCDLGYVREQTMYKVTKDPLVKLSYIVTKKMETDMIRKSDVVLTVSVKEKEIITSQIGFDDVVIAPIFALADKKTDADIPFSERKDLFFIGGFQHLPNGDGITWFVKEVFPIILRELPDIKLNIAGSNPGEDVLGLKGPYVRVLGKVDDDELEQLYRTCRVCVIPLRCGGGVKGKTVEAMYNRIGIVSTDFGIEGLPDIEHCLLPYNTAEDFAKEVIELYSNEQRYSAQIEACYAYAMAHFSTEAVEKMFAEVFA